MNKQTTFKILYIGLMLLFIITVDAIVGRVIPPHPLFLNSNDEYASNPRSYWTQSKKNSDNQTVFYIDRSKEQPRLTPQQKITLPPDKPAVMAIGDSFVYGQGVHLNDTFIHKYAEMTGSFPLNGGISGADILKIYEAAKIWIPLYKPQLVIYGYVLNDPVVDGVLSAHLDATSSPLLGESPLLWDFINHRSPHFYSQRSNWLQWLGQKSNIVDRTLQYLELRRVSQNTVLHYKELHSLKTNKMGIEKTLKYITEIKNITEASGGKFLVVIFPIFYHFRDYPFSEAHSTLSAQLTTHKIENIDLFPYFKNKNEAELWVHPSDQHPNELVHQQVANILKNYIEQ